jgi:ketosteroid isomerase-like protein
MSPEDLDAVRSVYSAWTAGDLEALLRVCDPGLELVTSGAFPDLSPVYRGHDGIRAFWQSMRVPWESFHLEPERIVEGEGCAVVAVRFRAQGKDSGAATELRQGHALWVKEGLLFKGSTHMSFDEALEAAGLAE